MAAHAQPRRGRSLWRTASRAAAFRWWHRADLARRSSPFVRTPPAPPLPPCTPLAAFAHPSCILPACVPRPLPLLQVAPGASPNLVFINVSPIEYGHVLLVPRALDNLPQLVGPDTLLLALQFAREAGERMPGLGTPGPRGQRCALVCPVAACTCSPSTGCVCMVACGCAHCPWPGLQQTMMAPPPPPCRQPLLPAGLQLAGRVRHHQPPALPGLLPGR